MTTNVGMNRTSRIVAVIVLTLGVAACNRIVVFDPPSSDALPDGYEIVETATYSPSGAGTEYWSEYWLVIPPEGVRAEEAVEAISFRLSQSGYTRVFELREGIWASGAFRLDATGQVNVGTFKSFLSLQITLTERQMESLSIASEGREGSSVVVLLAPPGG